MAITKNAKRRRPTRPKKSPVLDWRDAIRRQLAKVPEVDAVYVSAYGTYVHIYSVVEDFDDKMYKKLLKQEALVEKEFPRHYFEFHTTVHRGRKPDAADLSRCDVVFLR